ncbi:unnamed protein product [Xylocopa violacea]|uniref:Uncharacterized protein n=1 Tax=Xylocopa violacea TaxID=135666 RepID=A0ABP1NL49_XYLVO
MQHNRLDETNPRVFLMETYQKAYGLIIAMIGLLFVAMQMYRSELKSSSQLTSYGSVRPPIPYCTMLSYLTESSIYHSETALTEQHYIILNHALLWYSVAEKLFYIEEIHGISFPSL